MAKIVKKQLIKASALYKHMKIEVSGTSIIKKSLFGVEPRIINIVNELENEKLKANHTKSLLMARKLEEALIREEVERLSKFGV